jgi:hypothetical protein
MLQESDIRMGDDDSIVDGAIDRRSFLSGSFYLGLSIGHSGCGGFGGAEDRCVYEEESAAARWRTPSVEPSTAQAQLHPLGFPASAHITPSINRNRPFEQVSIEDGFLYPWRL